MERLQELEVLIAEQEKRVIEAWNPIEAKCQEVNKTFIAMVDLAIQAVTPNAKCTFSINEFGEGSGSCDILDNKGDRIFGAGFDLYFNHSYSSSEYHLTANVGTCGSFDKTSLDQINKYKMVVAVLENMENLENYLISQVDEFKPLRQVYYNADTELDKLKYEEEDIIKKANLAKAEAGLQVGNIYDVCCGHYRHTDFKGYSFAIIKEIQDKRILFRVGQFYLNADDTGYDFSEYDTYYYSKEAFCSRVLDGSVKHCVDTNDYCKNNRY